MKNILRKRIDYVLKDLLFPCHSCHSQELLEVPEHPIPEWKPNYEKFFCVCNQRKKSKRLLKKRRKLQEGRAIDSPDLYFNVEKKYRKTFHIKYEDNLSLVTKFILLSCQNKYIYYSIEDIMRIENVKEREKLLAFLVSSILSLHNNQSLNFFDIWVDRITVQYLPKSNRFLNTNKQHIQNFTYITLQLYYKIRSPIKKREPLW